MRSGIEPRSVLLIDEDRRGRRGAVPLLPLPGKLGRYEPLLLLAHGGMAHVYLARLRGPLDFEKLVAIKRIHPHLSHEKAFTDMLLDEAKIIGQIRHNNVAQVLDVVPDGRSCLIVMEYLEAEDLSAIVALCSRLGLRLDPWLAAEIVRQAAEGLDAAHEARSSGGDPMEVVHRDVSPSNIMVLHDGTIKIIDFGIAKARGRLSHSDPCEVKGKFAYMSPEQLQAAPVDRRSDIFSLGVVLWELLSGARLFRRENDAATIDAILHARRVAPSTVCAGVPTALDEISLRAIAIHPAHRFQRAKAMAAALRACVPEHVDPRALVVEHMRQFFDARLRERQILLGRILGREHPSGDTTVADLDALASEMSWASTSRVRIGLRDLDSGDGPHTPRLMADAMSMAAASLLPRERYWAPKTLHLRGLVEPGTERLDVRSEIGEPRADCFMRSLRSTSAFLKVLLGPLVSRIRRGKPWFARGLWKTALTRGLARLRGQARPEGSTRPIASARTYR